MKKWLPLFLSIVPLIATAHEGHGIFNPNSLMHFVGTPEHGLPIAAGVVLTAIILFRRKKGWTVGR